MDDDIERLSLFFPIKVVNGFVTCDFQLGCYCCHFCLNRRYPDWQRLLESKRVYRNPLQVEAAVGLLNQVAGLSRARVTLKIGHDTDMSLEEPQAQELVERLPASQPVIFMRRGRLLDPWRPFYLSPRPNLLVKVSITPRSDYLAYHEDPFVVLRSFEGLACNLFFSIGPVCHDNIEEAREIIRSLPSGSKVWVRDLIVKDIPAYSHASPERLGEDLRLFAAEAGHQVVHYENCLVRAGLGLGFHKRGEFVSEPNTWQLGLCQVCPVRASCGAEMSLEDEWSQIDLALDELGLTLTRPLERFGHKSFTVWVDQEVNFGDECYLRERSGLKVDLYKEGRKTGTALSASIARRWRERALFPVEEMVSLARDSMRIAQVA